MDLQFTIQFDLALSIKRKACAEQLYVYIQM